MYLIAYYLDENDNEKISSSAGFNISTINHFLEHTVFANQKIPVLKVNDQLLEFLKTENIKKEVDVSSELLRIIKEKYIILFELVGVDKGAVFLDFIRNSERNSKIKLSSKIPI